MEDVERIRRRQAKMIKEYEQRERSQNAIPENRQPSERVTSKSYVEGPRTSGLKKLLWQCAIYFDVELRIIDHDKGWFRETIYFEMTGTPRALMNMEQAIAQSIAEYNARSESDDKK